MGPNSRIDPPFAGIWLRRKHKGGMADMGISALPRAAVYVRSNSDRKKMDPSCSGG